ncbi:MAG TPA: hypothetical protein VL728_19200 [Cyclobacteriaceae bacterium]|jgi:hypothetical protein|nr:hypothetical protein [Cyclobacteriaceae bacterium]
MAPLRLDRTKFNNLLLLAAFYLLLVVSFGLVVKNEYAFQKVDLLYAFNAGRFLMVLFVVGTCMIILTASNLSDFQYAIAALILMFFVFPSTVIFSFVGQAGFRIPLSHVILFLTVLAIGKIKFRIQSNTWSTFTSKKILTWIVILGLIPFVILFLPYLNFKNLLLQDIYETREELGLAVNNLYTNYSYSWFNKFIIPCLLVFSYYYRDRVIALIGSAALIFLFLCGAHKVVFVGLIVTFVLYNYDYKQKINYFLKLVIVVGLLALSIALLFDSDFLMTMTLRRAWLLPAMVDVLYFDMFDNNHMLWSETFNGLFRTYPYDLEHSFLIGKNYFDEIIWGANNGIVSEGFMNAGMIGVLLNATIVGIYFSILNQLDISPKFFGMFFMFVFLIVSSSLPTVMVSHGGIILLVIAFLFLKRTTYTMS